LKQSRHAGVESPTLAKTMAFGFSRLALRICPNTINIYYAPNNALTYCFEILFNETIPSLFVTSMK
jgi:hypothetical protein